MIIIQQFIAKPMSYVYPVFSYFDPFSQALYPVILQTDVSAALPPLYAPNERSSNPQLQESGQFKPIVLSTINTLESLQLMETKPRSKKEQQEKKESPKSKDQSFGWRNQNKDRNLISSILKGYTQQLQQSQGMLKLVQKLAKTRSMQNGVSRFLQYVGQKFPSRKSYVGLRYMREALIQRAFDDDMAFLLNITLLHYLKEAYPLQIVETTKLRKKERLALLKKARSIRTMLFC